VGVEGGLTTEMVVLKCNHLALEFSKLPEKIKMK
jgi:hypothetical protein